MNGRARVSLLCLCVCDVILFSDRAQAQVYDYNVTIEAFTPRGFRISIPDDSRIKFFYIEYLLYKSNQFVNSSRQFVTEAKDGHRAVEDRNVTLSVGDVVRWTSFVALEWGDITPADQYGLNLEYHTSGVAKPYHNSIIREVVTRKNLVSPRTSNIIRTQVNNKEVAPNQVIFKDEFEGRALRRDLWHVAHYVPVDHPEHPFVSYQDDLYNPTVLVERGALHIRPLLQQNLPFFNNESLYSGTLDLRNRCTGSMCWVEGAGSLILPPVVSGRIRSRFAFQYGTVEIRAKLPRGDWIYPELLLEPKYTKYGSQSYSSGVIKIAMARGNVHLSDTNYESSVLQAGPILNAVCKGPFTYYKRKLFDGSPWSDDFHVYSVTWTPVSIEMAVDGQVWVSYKPGAAGLRSWLPRACGRAWYDLLDSPHKIAPFDSYFYLTIGLAVGGSSEFPDGLITGSDCPKPWRNKDPKASVRFWEHQNEWWPTWSQPELIVDYVRVTSV
ncbi:beta-1,3-glucan-binding protein-like isoform X1 [Leptidea sinapis]|uniref:beta-1,3-glucan-binding protein-like isoform X1 n=1 Tax=Leptidea sinapis TaxID=189913 RepID=UPI0021237D5D|nr:beta-1,3-glucan-binding protein-like isoform X1 [Leptidea sinapis]